MRTTLNEFEEDFAVTAVAIDTLWGGDFQDDTGERHLIVDAYCSGMDHPNIARPDLKEVFLAGGVTVNDTQQIEDFLAANDVQARLERLKHEHAPTIDDKWRRSSFEDQVEVLETQLDMRLARAKMRDPVPDAEAYKAAFGTDPRFVDTTKEKEHLTRALEAVGLPVTKSHSLADRAEQWRNRTLLDAHQMAEKWDGVTEHYREVTREHILPHLPAFAAEIPPNMEFGVLDADAHFSGVNLAYHSIVDGVPTYRTVLKIAQNTQMAEATFRILAMHEDMPGHGLHVPLMHAMYARGEYGFETSMMILCSPFATLAEGLATSTLDLCYGDDLEAALTPDEMVAYHLDDVNLAGRNNVVVRYIEGERDPESLVEFVMGENIWDKKTADKYVNKWLFHPLLGEMLGLMYLPSYSEGRIMVKNALKDNKREHVLPVLYGTQGQVDGINFPRRMAEYAAERAA